MWFYPDNCPKLISGNIEVETYSRLRSEPDNIPYPKSSKPGTQSIVFLFGKDDASLFESMFYCPNFFRLANVFTCFKIRDGISMNSGCLG